MTLRLVKCLKNMTADLMEVGGRCCRMSFVRRTRVGGVAVEQIPAIVAQLLQVGKTVAQLLAARDQIESLEPHELPRIPLSGIQPVTQFSASLMSGARSKYLRNRLDIVCRQYATGQMDAWTGSVFENAIQTLAAGVAFLARRTHRQVDRNISARAASIHGVELPLVMPDTSPVG